MSAEKLEYIWLDGQKPTQCLRSKTKIVHDFSGKLEDCPQWSFDGSSTQQDENDDFWFGFEQEYFLWDPETDKPLGFPAGGYPAPQGPYYCPVGANNAFGRDLVEEHMDICLEAGLNFEGINGEVAAGQWEFQIFAKGAKAVKALTKTGAVSGLLFSTDN